MLDHYCISCVFVLQTLYIYERSTWLPAVLCWRPHDSQFICVDNHGTVSCSLCFRPRVCQLFSVLTTTWLLAVFCVDNQVTLSCFLCFRPRDSQLFSLFQTTWLSAVFFVSDYVTLCCFLCFTPRDSQLYSFFQTAWLSAVFFRFRPHDSLLFWVFSLLQTT